MDFKKKLLFILLFLLPFSRPALAVDLATAFGIAGVPFPSPTGPARNCRFSAVHGGATTIGYVNILANGSDSAVVTLTCDGVSVTSSIPAIDVNGHQVSAVAFPQTITSSAPGVWTMTVAGLLQFTVTAQ